MPFVLLVGVVLTKLWGRGLCLSPGIPNRTKYVDSPMKLHGSFLGLSLTDPRGAGHAGGSFGGPRLLRGPWVISTIAPVLIHPTGIGVLFGCFGRRIDGPGLLGG